LLLCEGWEDFGDSLRYGLDGPFLGQAHEVFEFGEDLFDGVQIGTIWRQEEQPCSCFADGGPDGLCLVAAEIVHDHNITRPEARNEYLLDIKQEAFPVYGAIEHAWCRDLVAAQCRKERHGFPMTVRHTTDKPLAFRRPPSQWRHVGLGPRFVDEHEP